MRPPPGPARAATRSGTARRARRTPDVRARIVGSALAQHPGEPARSQRVPHRCVVDVVVTADQHLGAFGDLGPTPLVRGRARDDERTVAVEQPRAGVESQRPADDGDRQVRSECPSGAGSRRAGRAGPYPSAAAVDQPTSTTSARSRSAAKTRLSPGVCRPADSPSAAAAPSALATMLARMPPWSSHCAA